MTSHVHSAESVSVDDKKEYGGEEEWWIGENSGDVKHSDWVSQTHFRENADLSDRQAFQFKPSSMKSLTCTFGNLAQIFGSFEI